MEEVEREAEEELEKGAEDCLCIRAAEVSRE